MTLSSYRGISWVSHKRESSLSSLPTASPPSARNSSKTTSSPEAHSEKRPESPTPAPEVPLNDDSLKNLYGIRTVAMRRHSSHSVTSSVSNSSSAKPKSTTSESSTQGDVEASSPQRHATSKTSTVQSTTHSLPSPSAPDDLRALTPLAHHDHQRTDVLAEPPTDTTASNPTNVETPLRQSASLPIPSTSKSEDCSPPVHSQSLKSADTLTPFDPPSADSQPSLSKRSPVVKILQQKRRMASAPFFNKAPDFPHPTLTPPSGVLQLPDTSSDIPPPSSSRKPPPHVLPFYGRSARRARSRHPSRNNSETPPPSADVSTPASSSSRMPSSFSVSDLRPIRTQNLSSQELHGQLLSPREVVMTPTTEEWRSYGGKVGSSRLALRQRPRRQEGEEEGDTSRVSTPSSSDEEEAEDYVQMAHRSRRKSTNQDQLNQFETTSTRAHKPPERPKLRPRVIDGSQLSSGLALIDIPGLNRTVSAEHAGASLGPISLLTTGPIDPKRYSAITGLRNINSFTVERDAGAGAYGSVVQAREISTGVSPQLTDLFQILTFSSLA